MVFVIGIATLKIGLPYLLRGGYWVRQYAAGFRGELSNYRDFLEIGLSRNTRNERLTPEAAMEMFENSADRLIAFEQVRLLAEMRRSVGQIIKAALLKGKNGRSFRGLQSVPGVGKILGLTIALETMPAAAAAFAVNGFQSPK